MELFKSGVLNLFLTADRSALDNFTADHPGSAVKLSKGEGGGGVGDGEWVGSADR